MFYSLYIRYSFSLLCGWQSFIASDMSFLLQVFSICTKNFMIKSMLCVRSRRSVDGSIPQTWGSCNLLINAVSGKGSQCKRGAVGGNVLNGEEEGEEEKGGHKGGALDYSDVSAPSPMSPASTPTHCSTRRLTHSIKFVKINKTFTIKPFSGRSTVPRAGPYILRPCSCPDWSGTVTTRSQIYNQIKRTCDCFISLLPPRRVESCTWVCGNCCNGSLQRLISTNARTSIVTIWQE